MYTEINSAWQQLIGGHVIPLSHCEEQQVTGDHKGCSLMSHKVMWAVHKGAILTTECD